MILETFAAAFLLAMVVLATVLWVWSLGSEERLQ